MNKEFIRLMIKAKKIEIQALRQLFPENINEKIDEFGKEAKNFVKESLVEICFSEEVEESKNSSRKKKKVEIG